MSTERRLGVAAAVVEGELVPGDVAVAAGAISRVGLEGGGRGIALPGLVDLQVNGFGGVDLLDATDDAAWRHAGRELLRAGVTAYQPTLITAAPEAALAGLARAARLREDRDGGARILGVHLEGPFIAPGRMGAHPREHRREPDLALLGVLLAAGPVTMVTLAPERPGAESLIDALVARGIVVSVGHSEATAAEAAAAFDRGATAVTHLFNAMAPLAAREPGVAGAALADPRVTIGCIADGVHLAPETLRVALAAAGDRLALVSDAMAAAGMGDGEYRLGDVSVSVSDGQARRADGTLAGSVGTLLEGVRVLLGLGVPLPAAVAAASTVPARLLGRGDVGTLSPGSRADVLIVDDDLTITGVLLDGALVEEAVR